MDLFTYFDLQIILRGALDRLQKVGLISRSGTIYHANEQSNIHTINDRTSAAIQSHHRQMSQKAAEALTQRVDKREFQSLQLTFDLRRIKEAQARIREFVTQFDEEFRSDSSSEVYQLNVQCFALTKGEK